MISVGEEHRDAAFTAELAVSHKRAFLEMFVSEVSQVIISYFL